MIEEPPVQSAPTGSQPVSFQLPLHPSWLTRVILLLNILMFALLTLVTAWLTTLNFGEALLGGAPPSVLVLFGAKANTLIKSGEYWRLLTPIFLHIGVLHLIFNQYALSIFGREMETIFGTPRFAAIYLLSGLFGSLASFAFNPVISAGASGAIFGIIGAMAAFFLRNRETLGQMGRDQLRSLLVLIALNLFLGTSIQGIDNWGHIGGLVSGVLLGLLLAPTYSVERLPAPPFAHVVERPTRLPLPLVFAGGLLLLFFATTLALPLAP